MDTKLEALRARRARLLEGGGAARVGAQHAKGKHTARERLDLLLDPASFQETYLFAGGLGDKPVPGEGVVTGHGMIDGRVVFVASQDFTVAGGTVGAGTGRKITEAMHAALQVGAPFICLNDGGGARIQEGVHALGAFGRIFYRNVQLSGVVPQVSIIAGPCAGGAAYSPALTDFVVQVRRMGQMYITGPKVIREVTGEEITAEALGGVDCHARLSGVAHFVAEDDLDAMRITRKLLSFLPANNTENAPVVPDAGGGVVGPDAGFEGLVPEDPRVPYDVRAVVERLADAGDFLEVQAEFAPNLVVGFGRVAGHTVGFVANNPAAKAGVLDIDASDKGARFVRFCNAFNIPLVTLVDVPGFLPGVRQEQGGIIRHGAKMLFAYAAATVAKVTVVLRKAYGGAYLAMCAKDIGADRVCAWPTGEIAVMGAAGAVQILHRRSLAEAADPEALRGALIAAYEAEHAHPYRAADAGLVDDVIEPADTRLYVAQALAFLRTKTELRPAKKHGLIPL